MRIAVFFYLLLVPGQLFANLPRELDVIDLGIVPDSVHLPPPGDAVLIYNAKTGNVKIDASRTKSKKIISFVLGTNNNDMLPAKAKFPFFDVGTNTDKTVFQIGQTDPLNQGAGPIIDVGNILPAGMTKEALSQSIQLREYFSELGQGGNLGIRWEN